MSFSEEFVALCRSQVALLTQGLGASLSIVYLAEELNDGRDTKLVPVVAYPDIAATWDNEQVMAMLAQGRQRESGSLRLLGSDPESLNQVVPLPALPASEPTPSNPSNLFDQPAILPPQQVILPLIHEDTVMGLLVTARSDRPWLEPEQAQIERIARTLALASVIDQRGQWLGHDLHRQELLQAQQHDIFDDLLHQFRNPLTAIRTFGKLLMRRLLQKDENRNLAEGIVRESDRLQELLQRFDAAIDMGEADLIPVLDNATRQVRSAHSEKPTAPGEVPLLPGTHYLTGHALTLAPHTGAEILEPLLNSALAIAQDRQLDMQIYIPEQLPPVCADITALREVLSNLIDNALKYTPAFGQVQVQVGHERVSDQVQQQAFVIADTGPGIPQHDLEHLFERRYRGVQAQTDIPGTGLGLAIARELVNQMQGEIQVFSPAYTSGLVDFADNATTGTAVVVWLPEVTV